MTRIHMGFECKQSRPLGPGGSASFASECLAGSAAGNTPADMSVGRPVDIASLDRGSLVAANFGRLDRGNKPGSGLSSADIAAADRFAAGSHYPARIPSRRYGFADNRREAEATLRERGSNFSRSEYTPPRAGFQDL